VATQKTLPAELEAAVELARSRAEASGDLRPAFLDAPRAGLPEDAVAFVRQILTDGTYLEEVLRMGAEDPEVASI
jgi:hypothetical protein